MERTKLGLHSAVLCLVAVCGCGGGGGGNSGGTGGSGGETTTAIGGTGGETGVNGGGGAGGQTTPNGGTGGGQTTGSGGAATLAIHKLRLGDETPLGMPSSSAWKGYGFNIDGLVSTAASLDTCKPAAGGKPSIVYPDGDNGIDNAYGKNVLPIFKSFALDYSTQVNDSIDQGRFSVLVRIEELVAGGLGDFSSNAYTGGFAPGMLPLWDGGDLWPVRSDSLYGGNLATPKAFFAMSQVIENNSKRVWRTGGSGVSLSLVFESSDIKRLVVPIHQVRMSMELSDDNTSGKNGRIGGVINTEEFIAELAEWAGAIDESLCPPSSTLESIAQQIRQASDILADGSQDPLKTCNGISIGLGFEAETAGLGTVFNPPPVPDLCN